MKKLLSMLAVSTLVGTSASNLKPLFTSNVSQGFKSNQKNKNIIIKNENNTNLIEKDYRFLAHDWIKLKLSSNIFLDIKNKFNYKNQEESKTIILKSISEFPKSDNTGWGGSITKEDFDTITNCIFENFREINNCFEKLQKGQVLWIITNTICSWDKNDGMGVFIESSSNKIDNSNKIIAASITTGAGTTGMTLAIAGTTLLTTTELATTATALSAEATVLSTTAVATAKLATSVALTTAEVEAVTAATALSAEATALATTGTIATGINFIASIAAGAAVQASAATATVASEVTGLATTATALSAEATALATTGTILAVGAVGAVVLGAVLIIGAASFSVWYFW